MISERNIKVMGISFLMLMNLASGYMFEDGSASRFVLRFGTVLATTVLQWEIAHVLLKRLRRLYPQRNQTIKRLVRSFGWFTLISVVVQIIADLLIEQGINRLPLQADWWRIGTVLLQALLFAFTTIGLFEAVYYYQKYNRSEVEKELLLRTNLQSQLDSLKGQVNPHFLFNSLNTLGSLIRKDAQKAEAFLEEMAQVYRYLLRSNEQPLTTLEAELSFIQSYLHLLQTRFGTNLKVHIEVDDAYLCYLLPPLSLQLLVENVVKHNIISAEHPMDIYLFTTAGNRLHLVNSLHKKHQVLTSNKIGLSNIMAQYRVMQQPEVEVRETAETFTVIVPLIEANSSEVAGYERHIAPGNAW